MKKTTVSIIIGLVFIGIIIILVMDYLGKSPDKLGANPYEYSVEEYVDVDPSLIAYKETKNIPISGYKPGGIAVYDGFIWLTGANTLQAVSTSGMQKFLKETNGSGTAIAVNSDRIFIGYEDHVSTYTLDGDLIAEWDVPGRNCVFTSLALKGELLFVADAGNRRILKYNLDGDLLGEFQGQAESAAGHGFIVPSANFDILVNASGELWAVNPGKHALEKYSVDGKMLTSWQNSSMNIEGFTGCCNPAQIAVLPDGSFVTSEKGLVRIKIYDGSGKLKSVVAAPAKFEEEGKAPEVAVDADGVIYALDFDRSVIRVFEEN